MDEEVLKHLKWVATMIENEREETSQTVIFCETFNDIANVVSCFYEFEGTMPKRGKLKKHVQKRTSRAMETKELF